MILAAFVAAAPTSKRRAIGDAAGPFVAAVAVDVEGDAPPVELFLNDVGVELIDLSAGVLGLWLLCEEGDEARAAAGAEGRVELVALVVAVAGEPTRVPVEVLGAFARPRKGCLADAVVVAGAGDAEGVAAAACSFVSCSR